MYNNLAFRTFIHDESQTCLSAICEQSALLSLDASIGSDKLVMKGAQERNYGAWEHLLLLQHCKAVNACTALFCLKRKPAWVLAGAGRLWEPLKHCLPLHDAA